ncbi:MAG: PQQ-binding-like beta-propeller repeat protein, partial [Isosphaeraceae bacterium]
TGRPVWQVSAGMQQGFDPLLLADESPPAVIRYDDRDQAIVRTSLETGKTEWRQPLGDTPNQQPLVIGNRMIVVLPGKGQVLWLDLATGACRDGLDLQLPLAGSVLASQNNQTLYVLADQSVLFVLQVEPKACLRSVYFGHKKGTMKARPTRSGRFLIFPEQVGLRAGNLQTWLVDDRTGVPQRLQQEPLEGWPVFGPAQQGNLMWVSHDRGGFGIFSIGDYTLAKPLASVGKSPATTAPAHPTTTIAIGQREALVVDRTLKHYRLDPQSGRLNVMRSWELPEGYPSQPIQKIDDNTYLVTLSIHRDLGRAIIAFDIREDKPVWSTTWGMPVELAEERLTAGALRWIDASGGSFEMKIQPAAPGGLYSWQPPRKEPGPEGETTQQWVWHDAGKARIGLSGALPNRVMIRRQGSAEAQEVKLPVETGIPPLLIDDMLVIAGLGGEVAIASAKDGSPVGQPFVPDYEKTSPWKWQSLIGLEDKSIVLADDSGRLIRLVIEGMPAKLRQTSRVTLDGKFSGTLVSTGRAVLALMSGGSVVSLAGRDLSTQNTWTFPGAGTRLYPLGGAKALLCNPSGLIRLVDESGQTQVETRLANAMPTGRPLLEGKELAWLGQNKQSELILWKTDDPEPRRTPLGTWVQGPVFRGESGWLVVERPGVVRQVGSAIPSDEKKP